MSKSYEAPVEKVFGAMVQASSSHDIRLVSKDGCLVKFAAAMPGTALGAIGTALGGGAEAVITVDFTAMCSGRGDSTTVKVSATMKVGGHDRPILVGQVGTVNTFVKKTVSAFWSSMAFY